MPHIKRVLALLLVLVMLTVNLSPISVEAIIINDDGYIEIHTVADLDNIRKDLTAKYILMNDIDLSGSAWTTVGGTFSGELDGNGCSILSIEAELFNIVSGKVSNLWLDNVNIDSTSSTVGALARQAKGATITNCHVTGVVLGKENTGGLLGSGSGTVLRCSNAANVNGGSFTGGIIGQSLDSLIIEQCFNTGNITTEKQRGCYYTGSAGSQIVHYYYHNYAGGICGYIPTDIATSIKNCYNTGKIASVLPQASSGGNTGHHYSAYCGGIAGYGKPAVECCYNAGNVPDQTFDTGIGWGCTNPVYCYCIKSEDHYSPALTDSQAVLQSSYVGFDFDSVWVLNECAIYPYPQLQSNMQDPRIVNGISIATAPDKTVFDYEETLDLTGCTMNVSYEGGSVQMDVTADMVSGYNAKKPGVQTLTVSYRGSTATFDVTVNDKVTKIEIFSLPTKTEFLVGEAIDPEGGVIKVTYVTGKIEFHAITTDMLDWYDPNNLGKQTIQVTYEGQTALYNIQVIKLSSITVLTLPVKTEFVVGTVFDYTGTTIQANYDNGKTEILDVTADMVTGVDNNQAGTQTATVTHKDVTTTFDITVVPVAIVGLALESLPNKITYLEGQQLDVTGMQVLVVNNDGTRSPVVSGYTLYGYSSTAGEHTVTVGFAGMTAQFTVTVYAKTAESLTILSLPAKQEYVEGQALDMTGFVLMASFNNGTTGEVTEYNVSGFDSTPGSKIITVEYDGRTVVFPVYVIERKPISLQVKQLPHKLIYVENEPFNPAGMIVEMQYNDAQIVEISNYELTGFSTNPGTHTLYISYAGCSDSFDIVVQAKELMSLRITIPLKTTYYLGEPFDAEGLCVTALYSNGQQIDVDDYALSGFDSETSGIKKITVAYGGKSGTFDVVVTEQSVIETKGEFIVDDLVGRLGETVRIPVTVTNNTGLAGLRHELRFNTKDLKFVGVEMKGDYAKGTLIVNDSNAAGIPNGEGEPTTTGAITVVWFSNYDVRTSGLVYELVFEICETAADGFSKVELTFAENDNGNISGENVLFGAQDGGVEVRSWWLGDLNGDRKYAMVDLVMLAQYVAGLELTTTEKMLLSADVNEDGSIDIHDVVLLNQWLLAEDF